MGWNIASVMLSHVLTVVAGVDEALPCALNKAPDMVKAIQQGKAELYARVAYLQAQYRHLEEHLKQLGARCPGGGEGCAADTEIDIAGYMWYFADTE